MLSQPIEVRYARSEAKWFKRRLARTAMGQPFTEERPPRDYNEMVTNFNNKASVQVNKATAYVSNLFK